MTTYNFQFNSRWLIKTDTTQKITWQRVTMCYMPHCYILVYSTIFIITFSNNTLKNRIMLLFRKGYSVFLLEFLWCVVFGTKTATVSCTRSQKHKNRSNCNHQACLLTPYLGFFYIPLQISLITHVSQNIILCQRKLCEIQTDKTNVFKTTKMHSNGQN